MLSCFFYQLPFMKYGNNPNEQIYNWLFLKYYNFVIQDFCVTKNNTNVRIQQQVWVS